MQATSTFRIASKEETPSLEDDHEGYRIHTYHRACDRHTADGTEARRGPMISHAP